MPMRHHTYDAIRRLLEDGIWHDARELENVTPYADEWLVELRHDPDVEIKQDAGSVLVRYRAPVAIA